MSLSSDGVAGDGPSGKDNVGPDVERLFGTQFADTLATGPRGGELVPGNGDDTLTGGTGSDTIDAAYVEDVGTEAGTFYPQGQDTVTCGPGEDVALSDRSDVVAGDCEVVAVDNPGTIGGFSVRGSSHADVIGPLPYGWGPATVRAYSGNDTIRTAEVRRAYGGNGSDRIIGFDQAAQVFSGDAGNDRIDVRDKRAATFNRDVVHCGSGKDLVYANRNDKIARDCERVTRR
jgi:Ca2+-binding RTX toxin-like protein